MPDLSTSTSRGNHHLTGHPRLNFAKPRRAGTDGVSDVGRSEMSVVLFDHPRIGMAKVLGDYKKRHAVHGGEACPSMA